MPIFSTKAKKNLIVKKATNSETKNPINMLTKSKFIWSKSINKKTNAPAIVGMLSKNANFEASFKFNPIKSAPVIAIPDLEAPGIKAKH